jgi:hypothetical protein
MQRPALKPLHHTSFGTQSHTLQAAVLQIRELVPAKPLDLESLQLPQPFSISMRKIIPSLFHTDRKF